MTALEPRTARHEIAARQYEDVSSVSDALADRQQMAAAVEVAKKARVDAREWLWNAREAERALGRMIIAARKAGDLADHGGERSNIQGQYLATLADLDIHPNLAAYAVSLATHVPDDIWQTWREASDEEPSQAAIGRALERYRQEIDSARRQEAENKEQRKRLEAERTRVRQALTDLGKALKEVPEQVPAPPAPPLEPCPGELTGVVYAGPPPEADAVEDQAATTDDGLGELAAEVAQLQAQEQQARQELDERKAAAAAAKQEKAEAAARERRDARQSNTRLAQAMTILYGLGTPEAIDRCLRRWDPVNCDAPPNDVTAVNMRDAAATLEEIARLFEERSL